MIRRASLPRPAIYARAAAFLDVAAIMLWLLALSGVVSPHPWAFMLLGLVAFVLGVGAVVLAVFAWSRSLSSRIVTVWLVVVGALPPILVLVLAILALPLRNGT